MKENSKARSIVSWFEPVGRPVFKGPLKVSKILLKDPKRCDGTRSNLRKLVISVSASSGNAVKRNRFRRTVREALKNNWPPHFDTKEGIWLVLSRRFDLSQATKSWEKMLSSALLEVG